jgi:hypothetical protein
MLKKVLIACAALIAVLWIVVSMQPTEYRVERSAQMQASPDMIWAHISDFNTWRTWQPWWKSSQKITVDGTPGIVGHKSSWEGEKMGKGRMEITDVEQPNHLGLKLLAIEPMAGEATLAFDLAEGNDGTKVTWSMDGTNDFVDKFFSLVMNMDEMIGSKYKEGLADLKAIVEAEAKKKAMP